MPNPILNMGRPAQRFRHNYSNGSVLSFQSIKLFDAFTPTIS